jgi:DNA-binding transcriptional regulator YiaG
MTQHEHPSGVHVVSSYELDTLGAPFRVTLKNSVALSVDPKTKETLVEIPDLVGLVLTVVRCRVMDPRKLSGAELRFLRSTLGVPANKLAAFIDCSPEHYSRCEAGTKVLSPNAERHLRLFAFGATLCNHPESLLDRMGKKEPPKPLNTKAEKMLAKFFLEVFMRMKIEAVRDADAPIEYEFVRRSVADSYSAVIDWDDQGDDDWIKLGAPVPDAA